MLGVYPVTLSGYPQRFSPPPLSPPPAPPMPPPSPSPLPPEPPTSPSPPLSPPAPPSSPPLPLPPPTFYFNFSASASSSSGWSTGGGDPLFAFRRCPGAACGAVPSDTPESGGGATFDHYYYADASFARAPGDRFTLTYDGSACSSTGQGVSTASFWYLARGNSTTLRLVDAAGSFAWSLVSSEPSGAWRHASVDVYSPSLLFEFVRGADPNASAAVA